MGQIYRKTYFKSEEGVKAFQDLGIEYEDERRDLDYAEFLRKTQKTPEKDRVKRIQNIQRVVTKDGKEYLVYDLFEEAKDALGNNLTSYRHSLGCYHVPEGRYSVKVDVETGEKVKKFDGISNMNVGYNIPFTTEAVNKIQKYVTSDTQFVIRDIGHNDKKITVDSLEELKLGQTDHLIRFGHRASDYEQQILAEEKQGNYTHHKPPNAGLQYR